MSKQDADEVISYLYRSNYPDAKIILAKDIQCNNCGDCCKNENVGLTLSDIFRISKYLMIEPKEFVEKYCKYTMTSLNAPDGTPLDFFVFGLNTEGDCPFHKDNQCEIHDVKPLICKTFPILDPGSIREDILQKRDAKHPRCCVHGLECHTYIVPDINNLIDAQIGCMAQLEYVNKVGAKNKEFNQRIADGMYHKEIMTGKKKGIRKEVLEQQMQELAETFGELMDMDSCGESVADLGEYTPPYTMSIEK